MLDLNLDIICSSDSSCEENDYNNYKNKHMLFEGVEVEAKNLTLMEESATSYSSVVNNSEEVIITPGDENSSNDDPKSNASPFVFDFLKKDTSFKERKLREGLVGHELFPERSGTLELNLRPCSEVTRTQPRLGLPKEVVAQEVNVHGRTGRWESHIWDCGKQVYLGEFLTLMEESATSNSSVVNNSEEVITTPGDENSSNDDPKSNASPFVFDILMKDASFKERKLSEGLVGHELFPERSGSLELNLRPCSEVIRTQQKLGLPQEVNNIINREAELRIVHQKEKQVTKGRRGPRSRSSQYRGVTFYRRTGRWESHIWDCGKQVYLGGFDTAHAAARAYDQAAIKFRGVEADINFKLSDYDEDMKQMRCLRKEEFVQLIRRQCTGSSRGSLKFRGSALHRNDRWESRMGLFPGRAYDNTAINCNGVEVVSNFEHQMFKGEDNLVPNNGGSGCNLDLSLGISLPSNDQNTNQDRIATASSTMQTLDGLQLTFDYNPTWTGLLPGSLLNYEERTKDKGSEPSIVPCQMSGNKNYTTLSQLSIAASSGFSSHVAATSFTPPTTWPFSE